jgi:hypothetical protein
MPTPYDEQADLDLVATYLAAHGLSTERFSKEETLTGKTPNFRIRKGGVIVAYCEVKGPQEDHWLGVRSDPTLVILTPTSICSRGLKGLQVPHPPVADACVPLVGIGNLVLDASDHDTHEFGAPGLSVRGFEEHARRTPRQEGGHERINTLRGRHLENNIVRRVRNLAGRGHQIGKPGYHETVRSAEPIQSVDPGAKGSAEGGFNPDAR